MPAFTSLAVQLGGRYEWSRIPGVDYQYIAGFTVEVDGVPIVALPVVGKSFSGVEFVVTLPRRVSAVGISVRRERVVDRIGVRLDINRKFVSGDPRFDAAVYIESDATDAAVRRIFAVEEAREAVLEGLQAGAESIGVMEPRALVVSERLAVKLATPHTLSCFVGEKRLGDTPRMLGVCHALARLATAMQKEVATWDDAVTLDPPVATRRRRGIAALTAGVASWVLLVCISSPKTLDWRAFASGAGGGAMVWVVAVIVLAVGFRGRSTSLRNVVLLALLATGIIPAAGRFAEHLNAAASGAGRTVEIAATHPVHGKNGAFCTLTLAGGEEIHLQPFELCAGPTATVTLGAGSLGSRWVDRVAP